MSQEIKSHRLLPVRAEVWRDGEEIDRTPVDKDGHFARRLFLKPGDVVYLIHETATLVASRTDATIDRTSQRRDHDQVCFTSTGIRFQCGLTHPGYIRAHPGGLDA